MVHSRAFAYLSEYGQSDCGFAIGLKMSSLPTLALTSPKKSCILFTEFMEHKFQFLIEAVLQIIIFILC
jgi:hypothetical protein